LIFRGENIDAGSIKKMHIFSQDVSFGSLAYQLFRVPAKQTKARGGDIPDYPIKAGAADDVHAVFHQGFEVDCVSIRYRVVQLQLLGIQPGIFILLSGIRALYHLPPPLAILSESPSEPKSCARQN
jgi:hypothetical protein